MPLPGIEVQVHCWGYKVGHVCFPVRKLDMGWLVVHAFGNVKDEQMDKQVLTSHHALDYVELFILFSFLSHSKFKESNFQL